MVKIVLVEPGSYAAELGVAAGDQLVRINGVEVGDLIDFHRLLEADSVTVEIWNSAAAELWEFSLRKDPEEGIGLEIEHPGPRQCGNQCVFCFVHQLPKGLRRSLYIKDEDYRFSYLYGSYITLTNSSEADLERIIRDRLSPLYISVHAIDQQVRTGLLGAPVADLAPLLQRLTAHGIELHCQVVLCPGLNDGPVLAQTIEFLAGLMPQVRSLAVVPVGLTAHRQGLPQLRKMSVAEAGAALAQIEAYQEDFLARYGSRFVFPADEIYLLAGRDIPDLESYEDLAQLENGVGLIARFRGQVAEVLLEAEPLDLGRATLVTGELFAGELNSFARRLSLRTAVELDVQVIKNHFFGPDINVAGLITGTDLLMQLRGKDLGGALLLPDVMLKDGAAMLLDDLTPDDLREELGVPVVVVENTPWGVLEGLERCQDGPVEIIRC